MCSVIIVISLQASLVVDCYVTIQCILINLCDL